MAREKPDLLLHAGDLVSSGQEEWGWDPRFFAPAAGLLASMPTYPVYGNHEQGAPLMPLMFQPPPGSTRDHWAQSIGPALFIGIDGAKNWSADSENGKWLARTLAGSGADYIFLVSHYPAWSSSRHGTIGRDGHPRERACRQARDVIWPVLVRYGVTAMIAGHDHVYERSSPPGPTVQIITGAAGAPLYGKTENAAKQNPFSRAFASQLHYALFDISDGRCSVRVLTPAGKELDHFELLPRSAKRGQ